MKLKRLRIRNFRCFRAETALEFADFTALIGKNDSGKSTILEALDIFMNDLDPDKDDASRNGVPNDLTIICEFDDLPAEVVIDDAAATSLATEYLLNSAGHLEIHKAYSGHLHKPKCTSISAFALHPNAASVSDLLQLRNPGLRARAQELHVNLDGVNQNINSLIRSRIRDHVGDLQLTARHVPLTQENGKKIWDELKKYLPLYSLFKSDRPSTDQDPEAQDPLKAAIKEALQSREQELTQITNYVQGEVQRIADATLKKLREMDDSLASQLTPTFSPPKWDSLFRASITCEGEIPINKRGSGIKRLILLNFFRAKCEQLATETSRSNVIYAIEEPETSQHPNNQRMLFRALADFSGEAQIVISTHTPMLTRGLADNSLRFINVHNDNTREVLSGGAATNEMFAKSLGILPDNSVRLFIAVEGPNDIAFLQTISETLSNEDNNIRDLPKLELAGEVIFVPLGGSTLALWASRLANLNRPEFHLCDRDIAPPDAPRHAAHVTAINARPHCRARNTAKKEIENYLHRDAIIEGYAELNINLAIPTNFADFDNVPNEVARLVHIASGSPRAWGSLSTEEIAQKESKAKRVLCSRATRRMNIARLADIDPGDDLRSWFQDISTLLG